MANKTFAAFGLIRSLIGKRIPTQRFRLSVAFALMLVSCGFFFATPLLITEIIDNAARSRDLPLILFYSACIILAGAADFICWTAYWSLSITASEKIFLGLREELFSGILRKRLDFFSRHLSGDILTRLAGDLDAVGTFFRDTALKAAGFLIASVLLTGCLIAWNWRLGLVFLAGILPLQICIRRAHEPVSEKFRQARQALTSQNDALLDLLSGFREIRFFQQDERAAQRFAAAADRCTEKNITGLKRLNWTSIGMQFFSAVLVRLLPFTIGALLICSGTGDITVGMLIAYYIITFRIATLVTFVFQAVVSSAQVLPSAQRLAEIRDFPEELAPADPTLEDVPERTDIEFRSVSFAYPQSRTIFSGLNFRLETGEKVAVMGHSGSGKSTLAQLLIRFLRPAGGEILFGGKNIEEFPMSFYLSYFAYVGQETHLFRQSFRDNIAMGWYGVPLERIREVAGLVRMSEAIEKLPRGYDSVFGEESLNLSGGQKQRLALARALIRDPHILVLDEFTSGLDPETEKEILDDLFLIFRAQTIVCITHKQAVADRFDRVFYMPAIDEQAAEA